jgi:exosortase
MSEKHSEKQKIKAIILVGGRDFGRCPLASRLPTALWPVAGKPALSRLLDNLANQGVRDAVVCSDGDGALLAESIHADSCLNLKLLDQTLPAGTAGCVRDATLGQTDALLVVLHASIVCPPAIDGLIEAHQNGKSNLTVFFNPSDGNDNNTFGDAAGIYVCDTHLLEHIPEAGYFDIKEGLIPELLRAGKSIRAATLPRNTGSFRNRHEYLAAIANYLENMRETSEDSVPSDTASAKSIWLADDAKIDPGAKLSGPLVVLDGARVSRDVVILGPGVVGRNVIIGQGTIVTNSVLWDDARIGTSCYIQRCVVDNHADVPRNTIAQDRSIGYEANGAIETAVGKAVAAAKLGTTKLQQALHPYLGELGAKSTAHVVRHKTKILAWLPASILATGLLWSYWPEIVELWKVWRRSDEYSSGLLVPFLAIYVIWSRRDKIAQCRMAPCIWGLFAFVAAQAFRFWGLLFMYGSAQRVSIVLSVAALVLLLFGWQLFRKASTVLLFLFLMLPWPTRVQAAVALPLQRWATTSAVFCLETLGYEVLQEGNVIHIGQASVAVAEACNGLRMVTAFLVISSLVILLVKRALWEKLVVLASSLPIALLCNTTRLTITAIAFTVVSGEYWEKLFHDWGGYAMMPLALAAVVAEFWILMKLTTPAAQQQEIVITRQNQHQ